MNILDKLKQNQLFGYFKAIILKDILKISFRKAFLLKAMHKINEKNNCDFYSHFRILNFTLDKKLKLLILFVPRKYYLISGFICIKRFKRFEVFQYQKVCKVLNAICDDSRYIPHNISFLNESYCFAKSVKDFN